MRCEREAAIAAPPSVLDPTNTAGSTGGSANPNPNPNPHPTRVGAARWTAAGADRVRRRFEATIAALLPLGRVPPLVWRLYVRLEAMRGRWGAARRVLIRGVTACPWAKALWLDAAGLDMGGGGGGGGLGRGLRRAFEGDELGSLMEVAEDRGVRWRGDMPA